MKSQEVPRVQHTDTHESDDVRLQEMISRVAPLDRDAQDEARRRQDQLTKPPGSLGRMERLATHIAGITGRTWCVGR